VYGPARARLWGSWPGLRNRLEPAWRPARLWPRSITSKISLPYLVRRFPDVDTNALIILTSFNQPTWNANKPKRKEAKTPNRIAYITNPLRMLEHLRMPGPLPRREMHTAVATGVFDILRRVYKIRNTRQEDEEAER
jgi:hypothetical protein